MCGRYVFEDERDIEEVQSILRTLNEKFHNTPTIGEVFPTNRAAVLIDCAGQATLDVMHWGFPKWDGKGVLINARSESASAKKMFTEPLAQRRCVVLSTGFFEWKREKRTKCKYRFNCVDSPMLYMAGIYQYAQDGTGQFVILTREANTDMAQIHNRMPVILYKNELLDWMRDTSFIQEAFNRDTVKLEKELAL